MVKQDSWKRTDEIEIDLVNLLRSLCGQWKRAGSGGAFRRGRTGCWQRGTGDGRIRRNGADRDRRTGCCGCSPSGR